MYWQIILTVFMLLDFLQMAVAHCMVHQIPPRNFTLPYRLLNETFLSPFSAGVVESWSGLRREHGASKTKLPLLMNEESFLCCLWSDNNIDCSLYRASMQARKFIPSEINISASQEIDSNWNIECWIKGKLDLLVCSLRFLKLYLRDDMKVNLLYAVSELSLGDVFTSSLKGTIMVAPCDCSEYDKCECCVPSLRLNYTYIMWLKMVIGVTPLWSPLMSVKPIDIIKPEPPLNLHLEMAEKGQVKICWSDPVLMPYPLQYEVKISANSGQSGWQMVRVALETSLAIDNMLLDSSYLVQVRCRNHRGPGFWSDWSIPYNLNLGAEVLYFPPKILTSVGSNVSFHCIYKNKTKIVVSKKIVWWLNLAEEIPESQYTLVNDRVSKVTLFNLKATKPRGSFFYNALYCCHQNRECHHRYAELYVVDVNIAITCETDGYLTKMTCRWSANPNTLLLGSSLQLRYYRSKIYCSDFPSTSPKSEVKECHLQKNHSFECTFQPIFLLSGYTMWIEFKHLLGTLESSPTCVVPADVVKPLPPSNVKAEITRHVGLLNVSWTNPAFTNNDLQFQIRYAVNREEITWELYEVSNVPRSALIKVQKLCVEYVVQVRCRELDGSGYWSNWSRSAYTLVKDIKAPLQGPEFWRLITEDPARRQKNVTLLWKPLMKNHSLCSVSRYVIKHQTSGNTTWSEYVDNGTTCSFPWIERTHTVTILAMNSIGVSSINFNLTLSQQMSTVSAVQSLSAYPVNSTCVILIWTLSPQIYVITSFIIEWKNLNKEEEMKWVRVPPNISKYYIYDHFILIEKYQFSLYPVFAGGVGKSRATDQFTKGGYENENNASLYVVLPIVISTSVLLLGALLVSHQRMKKLFWEDVPNPKNCSWAQGVNFQKPETFEHLFIKHPEAMSFEPLLLEPEIVLEDISVTKALKKEDTQDFLVIDSMFTKMQDSERDSACSSSHFNSSSFFESSHDDKSSGEIRRQPDIKYATVIGDSRSSGLYEQKMNLRSCFDRCFLAEDSLVTGALSSSSWEVGNGAFLILPDPPGRQPSKTLSLSLISSEGFSEPSEQDDAFTDGDSPERSLYYLGITSLEKKENDIFVTEGSRVMCQFRTTSLLKDVGFLQRAPPNLNAFIQSSLKYKAVVPYMPQFQMTAAKVQETTEKNS
ncbi:leptin receptor isoform X3 [Falco biarmicus]|nr:leptin receptor isoform X3 [Falco rusticolus]XP_037259566.1 leptin receptor isoform X3 [Falco rusticolus]XP_055580793.1 leptin receptor isoform X3 [Falco cherrug]XP_055580794.1 leptin receptor isoform X3 [Falco cherrug]XP_056211967.1 leptin receptor isoform X3 [Falco biarmicus]XP_056211968.1 leptin receptor isoform X3 [Falco biarmicus]